MTRHCVKPKDLQIFRLGKITGVYIIYIPKINRSFICKPSQPRFFSLKIIARNISTMIELESECKFDEAKMILDKLDNEYIHTVDVQKNE